MPPLGQFVVAPPFGRCTQFDDLCRTANSLECVLPDVASVPLDTNQNRHKLAQEPGPELDPSGFIDWLARRNDAATHSRSKQVAGCLSGILGGLGRRGRRKVNSQRAEGSQL